MLLIGMVVGSILTAMFLGARTGSTQIGSGIRDVLSKRSAPTLAANAPAPQVPAVTAPDNSGALIYRDLLREEENVLPAIVERANRAREIVVNPPRSPKETYSTDQVRGVQQDRNIQASYGGTTLYMLQVGSFVNYNDADRLKAALSMKGYEARIQTVTLQNRGQRHRVQLGPYASSRDLEVLEPRVRALGLESMRVKVRG